MYGSAGSVILELAVVALLVIGIVSGVKKGFFKSLMDLLILAVAVFAAVFVCRWTTDALVERFYPKAEEKVLKAIENADVDLSNVDLASMNFDEDHPDSLTDAEYALLQQNAGIAKVTGAMEKAGIKESRIRQIIAKTLKKADKSGESLNEALTDSAKAATKTAVRVIVQVVVFLVVLIVLMILLQLLVNSMRGLMWKVDMLKTLDRFLGFLLGALIVLSIIFIVLYLCRRLGFESFEQKIGETLFANFLNDNNPISLFFD